MRIRQVKPAFWSDVKISRLSAEVKLIYIGLWMEADDSGWLRWDVEQIAADLFPQMEPEEAERIITEAGLILSSRGRLRILKCGHAQVPNLGRHQHLAGATRQVHTFAAEHQLCTKKRAKTEGPRGSPLPPAPVRLGQVRLGQVNRAGAREGPRQRVVWDGKQYRAEDMNSGG